MYRAVFVGICLFLSSTLLAQDQTLKSDNRKVSCDGSDYVCVKKYVNGLAYKTLLTPRAVVSVALSNDEKYTRLGVEVMNVSQTPFDVLPNSFSVSESSPKLKVLQMVPPEKIISSEKHRAGWANALNAMGAGMASQSITTETRSSGDVELTGNNGTYANGTYQGTSTSTTSVPDYAAQERARENIARRRATVTAHQVELNNTVLKDNTVEAGDKLSGSLFFELDKHAGDYVVDIPVDRVVYEFTFHQAKH
jgi:hypothetical protein